MERQPDPGRFQDGTEALHAQLLRFALERAGLRVVTKRRAGGRTHEQAPGASDARRGEVFRDRGSSAWDQGPDRLPLSEDFVQLDLHGRRMEAVMREEPTA